MSESLAVRGGRVIDPANGLDAVADVLIADGRVASVGEGVGKEAREAVDALAALVGAGIIPDASYIWWAIRPSVANPTLELRIADSCTRLDDAIAIAALFRCLVSALDRDRSVNVGFDRVGRYVTELSRRPNRLR